MLCISDNEVKTQIEAFRESPNADLYRIGETFSADVATDPGTVRSPFFLLFLRTFYAIQRNDARYSSKGLVFGLSINWENLKRFRDTIVCGTTV